MTGRDGNVMFFTTGRDGKKKLSRRDGTANKDNHDGTGRYIFLARRDGTVHISFHDGTGRYFFFPRREGTAPVFFRRDGTVHSCFHDGTGRYAFFFIVQESVRQEHNCSRHQSSSVTSYMYVVSCCMISYIQWVLIINYYT